MSQWQSIANNPPLDRQLLGLVDNEYMLIHWKRSEASERFIEQTNGLFRKEIIEGGRWVVGYGFFWKPANPTHWMLLPEVPV